MLNKRSHKQRLIGAVAAAAAALATPAGAEATDPNPCPDPVASVNLLCPDLVMSAPFSIYQQKARRGKRLLRSANSINSIGDGPAELRGQRSSKYRMKAKQRIYRVSGPPADFETGAGLRFHNIPGFGGYYWKFNHAAQFELWAVSDEGQRTKRVRRGEKTIYCLRDLARTRPDIVESPAQRHYPRCNQSIHTQAVTLGTSVGWSDIYPANYYEQYIDVTGLRGCFAYIHVADPDNHIYEVNEKNNRSQTVVRLPWKGSGLRGCKYPPLDDIPAPAPIPGAPAAAPAPAY